MNSDDDNPGERDAELLRVFSSAPTAAERAEALRGMYAEKRTGKLKASPAFREGIEWLGAVLSGDDEAERLVALATLERIRSLSNELEQIVDGVTASGLEAPIESLEACESGEDRARVAAVIGRHRPVWATLILAESAVHEPAGAKVSKARAAAIEALLSSVGTFEDTLHALATALHPRSGSVAGGAARRLASVLRELRILLGTHREALGGSPGKALAKLASSLEPRGKSAIKPEHLREAAEEVALFMHEIVRSRVSFVVDPATYAALTQIRDWMHTTSATAWTEFARSSPGLLFLRDDLAEAIVIRALSGIPDDTLFQKLQATCESSDAARELGKKLAARAGISPRLQRWLQHGQVDFSERQDPFEQLRAESEVGRIAQVLLDSQRLDLAATQVRDAVLPEVELVAPRLMPPLRTEHNLIQALLDGARALAVGRGLRCHGSPGDTVDFLPSHHHVAGGPMRGVTQVRIVTPAVEEVAADGTTRVVVQAIVEAVT